LRLAREYVDFSLRRLFLVPGLALVLGLVLGRGMIEIPGIGGNDWRTAAAKMVVFCGAYGAALALLERRQVSEMLSMLWNHVGLAKE